MPACFLTIFVIPCGQESRGELKVVPRPSPPSTAPGGGESAPPGVESGTAGVPGAALATAVATSVGGPPVDEQEAMLAFLRLESRRC